MTSGSELLPRVFVVLMQRQRSVLMSVAPATTKGPMDTWSDQVGV